MMNEPERKSVAKPPLPTRPSSLFPSSKDPALPKPPENSFSDSMKDFINSLNLDVKDDNYESFDEDQTTEPVKSVVRDSFRSSSQSLSSQSSASVDLELYGYMQPVCVPILNRSSNCCKEIALPDGSPPSPPRNKKDTETSKFSGIFRKVISKSSASTCSSDGRDTCDSGGSSNSAGNECTKQQQRPLPLLPTVDVTNMPWYKDVDRKKGEELLKKGVDGYFLVRPSSKGHNSLTLTLWFHNRLYNIPIRRRSDMQYALGTPKANEQSFNNIEEMISNYQSEKLVLYSGGVKTGKTLLTSYP